MLSELQISEIAENLVIGLVAFVNKDTLEIKSLPDISLALDNDWIDSEIELIHKDWAHYCRIDLPSHDEVLNYMHEFLVDMDESELKEMLKQSFKHFNPVHDFKLIIEHSPYRDAWIHFRNGKYFDYAVQTLKAHGLIMRPKVYK